MMRRQIIDGVDQASQKLTAEINRMPWFWRRIAVAGILIWSMSLLTYLAAVGTENTRSDIAFYLSGILISTMASYLGIATIDHQNERKANLAASAISPPTEVGPVQTDVNVKV